MSNKRTLLRTEERLLETLIICNLIVSPRTFYKTYGINWHRIGSCFPPTLQSDCGADGLQVDEFSHLCDLVDFAAELNYKLEDINKHSFNEFKLRMGLAVGPLVCGVIGATKATPTVASNGIT